MKLDISRDISENCQISYLVKICPGGAELCLAGGRTDGQTDMTNQIVVFHIVANARNKTIAKQ